MTERTRWSPNILVIRLFMLFVIASDSVKNEFLCRVNNFFGNSDHESIFSYRVFYIIQIRNNFFQYSIIYE